MDAVAVVLPDWAMKLPYREREAARDLLAARLSLLVAQRACVEAGLDGDAVYRGVQAALEGVVAAIAAVRGL